MIDLSDKEKEIKKDPDDGRRKALKKLGSYACASAVMVSLVASQKVSALSPPNPP